MEETNTDQHENHPQSEAFDILISRLHHNLWFYREVDPANRSLGAFANATIQAISTIPSFRQNISDTLALRPELNPSHFIKLLERSYGADFIQNDPSFPDGYERTQKWLDGFIDIEADEERSEILIYRMLTHRVQSNIPERYKIHKLLRVAYGNRFDGNTSLLDVGTSELLGLKKLFIDQRSKSMSFKNIKGVGTLDDNELELVRTGEAEPTIEKRLTLLANRALKQTITFSSMRGVDIMHADHPSVLPWVESCSLYPDERRDKQRLKEFHDLVDFDPEHKKVRFSQMDFESPDDIEKLNDETDNEKYDWISMLTVRYQTDDKGEVMFEHAKSLLKPNGIVVTQDSLKGNFEDPFGYKVLVYDNSAPELGEQEIALWKNARCKELMAGIGRLIVKGRLLHIDEAIEAQLGA